MELNRNDYTLRKISCFGVGQLVAEKEYFITFKM